MFHGKKIVVVMPAYNAARTIEQTYREIPLDLVDEVIVTDDASGDDTVEIAQRLGLRTLVHGTNRGYGANQKTCYTEALRLGADVAIMLHPDYQYTPKLLPAMIGLITDGPFDVVLGSRVLGGHALSGGMPWLEIMMLSYKESWPLPTLYMPTVVAGSLTPSPPVTYTSTRFAVAS